MSLITNLLLRKASGRSLAASMAASDSFTYAGWTITAAPPAVQGAGKFAPSPTAPLRIRSADGAWLPPQTITPAKPIAPNVRADSKPDDEAESWSLVASNGRTLSLAFILTLPAGRRCDVDMTLNLAACTPGPPTFSITVNEQALKLHYATDQDWAAQRIAIPARLLTDGANRIVLSPLAGYYGVWLQSVHFASRSVPISVGSQWLQVCCGELGPGDRFDRTIQIAQGTLMTDLQIRSFAQQFGLAVEGVDVEDLLTCLGDHLATRFYFEERGRHSTSLARQTTVDFRARIGPAQSDGMSFQIWQLALVYEANGCELVQALGPDGPIVLQQFPSSR